MRNGGGIRRLGKSGRFGKPRRLGRIGAMAILLALAVWMAGCDAGSEERSSSAAAAPMLGETEEEERDYDTEILGVVKGFDLAQRSVTLYDVDKKVDLILTYTGGTDIRNAHDKMITMDQLEIGEIVDGYYYFSNRKLTALHVSKDAWTYRGASGLFVDPEENVITIAGRKYQYEDDIVISDGADFLETIDINERDEMVVKGVASRVYSLRLTKGHGYIRLKNEDAFLGGTIEVGYGIIVPVVRDMLLVAREGTYRVLLENGNLQAEKTITLMRDEELTLDLSDYPIEEEEVGFVSFRVSPVGADLYINGILVNYAEPIKLNYGEHVIRVSMTGYSDFMGILNIGESSSTVRISLAEEGSGASGGSSASASSGGTASQGASGLTGQAGVSGGAGSSGQTGASGSAGSASQAGSSTQAGSSGQGDDGSGASGGSSGDAQGQQGGTTVEETDGQDGAEVMGDAQLDENHTISVTEPVGARVYVNGSLMGTAPITFPKEIGTLTVTLSKEGCVTKSYTVETEDDKENVRLSFPDMEEAE